MPLQPEFRVDFVIGGTQKGGTTALAQFLGSHPDICFSKQKEPHFFDAPDFPERAEPAEIARRYRAAFPEASSGRVVGEATPISMYLPWVPSRVARYNPAMKWVLLLRDPTGRAVSHYRMERGRGAERRSLAWALRLERYRLWRDRARMDWRSSLRCHSYATRGFYSVQIARLWKLFPKEQVLILTSDDLRAEHAETLRTVYRFLGVAEPSEMPPAQTVFATEDQTPVPARVQAALRGRFAREVDRLEKMLGRSLDSWRAGSDNE